MVRRRVLGAVGACALAALTVPVAAPAWAATGRVLATSPSEGAALREAPGAVRLVLSDVPDPALSHVSVRDAHGNDVRDGDVARAVGRELRQPVAIATTGDFTVAYHVTFVSAGEVTGVARFSVGTGQAPAAVAVGEHEHHQVDPLSGTLLVVDAAVLVGVALLLLRRPAPPLDP
jgi:methionine-rich copper-binding protein CopC